jgi:hypothetical protein
LLKDCVSAAEPKPSAFPDGEKHETAFLNLGADLARRHRLFGDPDDLRAAIQYGMCWPTAATRSHVALPWPDRPIAQGHQLGA